MIRDKTMLKNKFMIVLVFLVLCTAGLCSGEVIYVDANAPGANNGESWADAYTDLQSALGDPCLVSGDEIWVAAGVYKPTTGSDIGARFSLVDGVDMYGGFAGDEVNLDDLASSCVGLWPMDDNVANPTVIDSSGNGNDGTANLNTDLLHTTGKIDGALTFDGSSDYVDVGIALTGAYTKVAWVKRTTAAGNFYNNIISSDTQSHFFWAPYHLSYKLTAGQNTSYEVVQDDVPLAADVWYHVAVTYDPAVDSGRMSLYKDGAPVSGPKAVATGVALQNPSTTTYIGRFLTGYNFGGSIDNVMLFDRALTAEEIEVLYKDGSEVDNATSVPTRANKTYLSGELVADNSIRIIYAVNINNSAVIDGFEISGADYGIWVSGTNLSIANCTITNNKIDGIYCSVGSDVDITDCSINNNGRDGIRCWGLSEMILTGSKIGDNGEDGVNCYGINDTIKNNWIHHNGQEGIYCYSPNSSGIVQNNTIVYNTGSGIYNNENNVYYTPTISNCIFWGNGDDLYHCEATYSCIEDPCDTGDGVIHSDPWFAFSNPELRNFHLSVDSNCIDAGDPCGVYTGQVDIDGQMRVVHGGSGYGRIVDIGGDELAGPDIDTLADINLDGIVNLLDYAAFGPTWDKPPSDPNWDGRCNLEVDDVIDTADYVIFINEWLWQASWRASEDVFDFDGGGVGVSDFYIFVEAWLSQRGDGNYNAACDYDGRDGVNIVDFSIFAGHWMD